MAIIHILSWPVKKRIMLTVKICYNVQRWVILTPLLSYLMNMMMVY